MYNIFVHNFLSMQSSFPRFICSLYDLCFFEMKYYTVWSITRCADMPLRADVPLHADMPHLPLLFVIPVPALYP